MMRRLLNLFRAAVFSLETIFALAVVAFFQWVPAFFIKIGNWYISEANWSIAVLPIAGISLFAVAQVKEILFPIEGHAGVLKDWPDYLLLKDTVYLGLFYCFLFLIAAVILFIFRREMSEKLIGLLFSILLLMPFMSAASLFIAKMNINFLLERLK